MRTTTAFAITLILSLAVTGCGGGTAPADRDPDPAATSDIETSPAPDLSAVVREESRCPDLEAGLVAHDVAGTPFPLGFDVPSGFGVDGLFTDTVASADIVKNLDEDRSPEYVLRFGMPREPNDNVGGLAETWRKMERMEVEEVPSDRGAYVVGTMTLGELRGFQVIVPSGEADSGWVVTGGVTRAPDGCEDRALEVVEDILLTLRPNPAMTEPEG